MGHERGQACARRGQLGGSAPWHAAAGTQAQAGSEQAQACSPDGTYMQTHVNLYAHTFMRASSIVSGVRLIAWRRAASRAA